MHVTGFWSAVGAVITGLIIADLLYHYTAGTKYLGGISKLTTKESSLLAGRG